MWVHSDSSLFEGGISTFLIDSTTLEELLASVMTVACPLSGCRPAEKLHRVGNRFRLKLVSLSSFLSLFPSITVPLSLFLCCLLSSSRIVNDAESSSGKFKRVQPFQRSSLLIGSSFIRVAALASRLRLPHDRTSNRMKARGQP